MPFSVAMSIKQGRRELVLTDASDAATKPAQRPDLSKHATGTLGS